MNLPTTKRHQISRTQLPKTQLPKTQLPKTQLSKKLRLERLEDRHLLAGDEVLGTVSGRVWLDDDANGIQDAGESGVGGTTLVLQDLDRQIQSQILASQADGSYVFDNVPTGRYELFLYADNLVLTLPSQGDSSELDSDFEEVPRRTSVFTVSAEQPSHDFDAGLIPAASIQGTIWHDADQDGIRSDTESGVGGAVVRLLDADQQVVAMRYSRASDSSSQPDGDYRLRGLRPGQYTLELSLPNGVAISEADQSGDETNDSDFDPATRLLPITVGIGEQITDIDAGLSNLASVVGRVWEDLNGNGIREQDEPGIPGLSAVLQSRDGAGVGISAQTDANGEYRFDPLLPGKYAVTSVGRLPNDAIFTDRDQGDDDTIDSDSLPRDGGIPAFTLAAGETNDTLGTGIIRPGTILGTVWIDINHNGVRDSSEPPAPFTKVQLLGSDGTVIQTDLTSTAGLYRFDTMPGDYGLQLIVGDGVAISDGGVGDDRDRDSDFYPTSGQTEPFFLLSEGVLQFDAGIMGTGEVTRISGTVFNDSNGDGINSFEPGVGGMTVKLVATSSGVEWTTETLADGSYAFSDVPQGRYFVEYETPQGATLSPMNRGLEAQQDSSPNRTSRQTALFSLIPGQQLTSIDAGIYTGTFPGNVVDSLRITEVQFIGVEYVELKNIGDEPIDLNGVRFINGIAFDFTTADLSTLFPGELTVVVGNMAQFASWYDTETMNVSGVYSGDINQEERLELVAPINDTILDFRFDDDWFRIVDDEDISFFPITVIDENAPVDSWDGPENWRLSSLERGTPGVDDPRLTPDPGAIVINEILTNPTIGDNDWIELHNTTDRPIDVGNWFLGDDNEREDITRYQIAPNTIIPAGGYLVLTRNDHFGNPDDPGARDPFGLDRDGEEILLTGGNAEGELLGYSESYRFDGVEDGTTLGLHVTSTGESVFTALTEPTPGQANSLPRVGPVVINEIMYRPAFLQDEFIELYNASDQDIDLGKTEDGDSLSWILTRSGATNGIVADFIEGDIIPAHGYLLVVPGDPQLFRATYAVPQDVTIVGPWLLDPNWPLSNAGENLQLYRRDPDVDFVQVDQIAYSDDAPWPEEADIGGGSLERIRVDEFGNDPANWGVTTILGGSPGRRNTIAERIAGDFDGDTWVNATDIDILTTMIDRGTTGPVFDLTSDGTVDSSDVDYLVNDLLGTTYGDSDLNGQVDLLDLARLSRNFGRTSEVGWASGDTNADGSVDRRDIVRTLFGMAGPATATASPAPVTPAAWVNAVDQAIGQSNAELSQTSLTARRAMRPLRLSITQRGTTAGEGVTFPTRQMLRSHRSLSVAGRLQTTARDVRLIDAALRDSLEFVSSLRSRRLV